MEVAAKASLDLADAYLTGGAAGIEADARRKAATDATRKGIDVEQQVRRQLALTVAEGVATSAKSVDQLRQETVARAAANDNVAAGTLAASRVNQALSDEAALRPLLTLRTLAHGEALAELNKVVDAYTAALAKAHSEEARSGAQAALAGLDDRVKEAQADLAYVGDTSGRRERGVARRAAARESRDRGYDGQSGAEFEAQSVGAVDAELTTRRASSAAGALRSQQDRNALLQAEIGLVGKSADQHDRVLASLQLEQQLAGELGDDYDRFAPAVLAAADATEVSREKLQALTNDWQELRQAGDQFLDDLTNPDGSGIKRLLQDIEQEFIKLALLNPLKNMLFGEKNPTLGGVLGNIGKLFNHGAPAPGKNASGTERWSGGMTWVNENGPEIADLPGGTRIYPASETRRMLAGNDNASPSRIGVDIKLNTDLFTAAVAGAADQRIGVAAPSIAAGGAQLSAVTAARRGRRKLGRAA